MIIEEVIRFLKKSPPFQFLSEEDLQWIATNLTMEFYPKGTLILRQGEKNVEALRIIKKGAVKVFMKSSTGDEVTIDYRGEGDNFGLWSIISGESQRTNVIATDDTICYLLDKNMFLQLLEKNALLSEYFLKSHLSKYLDKAFKDMTQRSLTISESERILFTTTIEDIASKEVITAHIDSSIQEIANLMSHHKISSIVIVDERNIPVGIVTDRDLREKVVAKGRNVSESVKNIMSLPLIRIDANDYCYEAILKMIRHKIHHLLVIKEGKLIGILTNHDLMLLQGTSPLTIAREIESQQAVAGLAPLSKKIIKLVGLLLKEGARSTNIARIITEINDSLVRRVLEIAEKKYGRPPVPYCFIVYGSEGRKEQTFKTDQDNAIIYADPQTEKDKGIAKEYFEVFSNFVISSLLECGFPLCPANNMANNPKWRQPLSVWKKYFNNWITIPTPEAILKSLIFFDFRYLFGEQSLAEELKDYLFTTVKGQEQFFSEMADAITKNRPPLSIFKKIIVEKTGEHKNMLDLKIRGIAPIVDIARLCAIDAGVRETSTIDRIRLLKDIPSMLKKYSDDLEYAFEFMTMLRIHHQLKQIEMEEIPDNYIMPDRLTNLEKKTLKESFHLILDIQDAIVKRYVPPALRS
jgi:CBS domain-containing protein